MSLKIKSGVVLDELRKFGFATGRELAAHGGDYANIFDGCDYMLDWWHKFALYPGDETRPHLTNGVPVCHAWVDTEDGKNFLWFDAAPDCTYHVGMDELDCITDTVYTLTRAGLLERS